jgi:hypothetical protein
MKLNYNINHKFCELPVFKDLKNQERQATLIMLSCCSHLHILVGHCDFYKRMMSKDWAINMKAFAKAEKILIGADYLKVIKFASKTDKTPARYLTTDTFKADAKLYCDVNIPIKGYKKPIKKEVKLTPHKLKVVQSNSFTD